MAMMVFVYPMLARAACPCPEGATQQLHAKIHNETPAAQNQNDDGEKPCHGENHDAKSSPTSDHHDSQKGCCSISAADFDLVKVDLSLSSAKQQLEKKLFNVAFLYSYIISNQSFLEIGARQRYGPSTNQFVRHTPLYKQFQSFLI